MNRQSAQRPLFVSVTERSETPTRPLLLAADALPSWQTRKTAGHHEGGERERQRKASKETRRRGGMEVASKKVNSEGWEEALR